MNTPVKPWPLDMVGTTRGTGLEAAEKWAVSQPIRYRELHRVTLAEIEPDNLVAAQRQAADERAQHAAFMARQRGTGEVYDPEPDAPTAKAAALILLGYLIDTALHHRLVLAGAVVAICSVGVIVWSAA